MKRPATKNASDFVLTHKVEVLATKDQVKTLRKHMVGSAEFYNMAIHYNRTFLKAREDGLIEKMPTKNEFDRLLRADRNAVPFYDQFDKASLNNTIDIYHEAMQRAFARLKQKQKPGFPRRKFLTDVTSFRAYNAGQPPKVSPCKNFIHMPKKMGGTYRLKEPLRYDGPPKMITASIRCGKIFFSISFGVDKPPQRIKPNRKLGIDLGARSSMCFDGKDYATIGNDLDELTFRQRKKIAKENRKLARKKGGYCPIKKRVVRPSRSYFKQKQKISWLYYKHANQRRELRHRITSRMVKENMAIALQRDNLKAFCVKKKNKDGSNKRLIQTSKTYSRMGWGYFLEQLKYKSKIYDVDYQELSRWLPMTRLCAECGHKNSKKTTRIGKSKTFVCEGCSKPLHRDKNSAKNIFTYAYSEVKKKAS